MSHADRLSAVVFDLDGLMFNTETLYQHVGTELLARRGKRFEAELLDRMMGRPNAVALQIMIDWHGLSDTVPILANESEQIFAGILDEQLECMPGLHQLMDALEIGRRPQGDRHEQRPAIRTERFEPIRLRPAFQVHPHKRGRVRGQAAA